MTRFASKTFKKKLRRKHATRKIHRVRKGLKKLRGGGNTLSRAIPKAAVRANPLDTDEYRGDDALGEV